MGSQCIASKMAVFSATGSPTELLIYNREQHEHKSRERPLISMETAIKDNLDTFFKLGMGLIFAVVGGGTSSITLRQFKLN